MLAVGVNAIVVVLWSIGVRLCGNGVVLFDIVVEIGSVGEVAIWTVVIGSVVWFSSIGSVVSGTVVLGAVWLVPGIV